MEFVYHASLNVKRVAIIAVATPVLMDPIDKPQIVLSVSHLVPLVPHYLLASPVLVDIIRILQDVSNVRFLVPHVLLMVLVTLV